MLEVRAGRFVGLWILAFTLLAGPVQAECASCCPSDSEQNLEIGSLGCCGNPCGVAFERPDSDRAATSIERHSFGLVVMSTVATPLSGDLRAGEISSATFDLSPPVPSSTPSPLRL
jgi:hypothetical protein